MLDLAKQLHDLPIATLALRVSLCVLILLPVVASLTRAQDAHEAPNLPTPTLGGKQFWSDVFIHVGWRIQENVLTGHARLLDDNHVRRAWGSYDHCRERFEAERQRGDLEWSSAHLVILVHGLGGARQTLNDLETGLRHRGHNVMSIVYPSTRQGLSAHGDGVAQVLSRLENIERVSFVSYSLGGLVVREVLGRADVKALPLTVDQLVMIAPPNQGAQAAELLHTVPGYDLFLTSTGQDVRPRQVRSLFVPDIPVGIIVGGAGNDNGYNPLLDGDDDGLVRVDETLISGAVDYLFVKDSHWTIKDNPKVISATHNFLQSGRFEAVQ